jgi:hypothetical protein
MNRPGWNEVFLGNYCIHNGRKERRRKCACYSLMVPVLAAGKKMPFIFSVNALFGGQ